ncbi:hypothetical protein [Phenylobacterium sp. SCN 70-31]|uniref:hypothetical protein n=1 Tax=Phenylobacterium sp. SCN 70-31 TaxID=1660129 RepID=UPI00086D7757|nr:hypothetical protein [Phenylobacterium sp. SCN 70-31]ODT86542.1 MAG: hypothetical protein ABS78_15615 [Phenylobacterium sp. SCN 70-31]
MPTPHFIAAAESGRWDIYGPIHKGLRLAHGELLHRLGAADFVSAAPRQLLADLRAHLALAAAHLEHEDTVIHPALAGRAANATAGLEDDHLHHRARLAMLESALLATEHAAPSDRPALGRSLYLAFSTFVAEDLAHMGREETEIWPRLCALFADEELAALEMSIVSSLSPAENIAFMRIMLPAMNRAERSALLSAMKSSAPADAYAEVIERAARPTLAPDDMSHLSELGLAA